MVVKTEGRALRELGEVCALSRRKSEVGKSKEPGQTQPVGHGEAYGFTSN